LSRHASMCRSPPFLLTAYFFVTSRFLTLMVLAAEAAVQADRAWLAE
jgi:hypothetical protein